MGPFATDPNILGILGVAAREDVISNLVAYCYNSAATFRVSFGRAIGLPDRKIGDVGSKAPCTRS